MWIIQSDYSRGRHRRGVSTLPLQLLQASVASLSAGTCLIVRREQDDYEVVRKVGRGKYSEVFEGVNIANTERCIIKILKPVKKKKVRSGLLSVLEHRKGAHVLTVCARLVQLESLIDKLPREDERREHSRGYMVWNKPTTFTPRIVSWGSPPQNVFVQILKVHALTQGGMRYSTRLGFISL